jgi:hypothetical protein
MIMPAGLHMVRPNAFPLCAFAARAGGGDEQPLPPDIRREENTPVADTKPEVALQFPCQCSNLRMHEGLLRRLEVLQRLQDAAPGRLVEFEETLGAFS